MNTRRFWSLLCAFVCAVLLMLAVGNQRGIAQNKVREFTPIVDGAIIDQSPFDGIGDVDGIAEDITNVVFLNVPLAEARAVMEFDLENISPNRIESAILKIESTGTGALPGTLTIPVEVNGYLGNGTLQSDYFSAGTFITIFDTLATPDHVPQFIDVTEFFQNIRPANQRIVGFTFRTDVHGVQVNYGSVEFGPAPVLIVTLK